MRIGVNRLGFIFAVCFLALAPLSATQIGSAALSGGASSRAANAVWVDPSAIDVSSADVGYRFNVTVWANLSGPSFAWQVSLNFNPAHLRAVRADYTGQGKSRFFTGHTTVPVNPVIRNAEGQMLYGESLLGSDTRPAGNDSLCSIEFEVISQMSQTRLDINNKDTCILDANVDFVACMKYSAVVSQMSGNGVYIIGIAPSQVYSGTSVRVYGGGATPKGLVESLIHGPVNQIAFVSNDSLPFVIVGPGNLTLGSAYTSESGAWEIGFVTPNLAPGEYDVYVLDNETLSSDAIPFEVQVNVTVIAPNSTSIIFSPGSASILSFGHIWMLGGVPQNVTLSTTTTTTVAFSSWPFLLLLVAGVLASGGTTLLLLIVFATRRNNPRRRYTHKMKLYPAGASLID